VCAIESQTTFTLSHGRQMVKTPAMTQNDRPTTHFSTSSPLACPNCLYLIAFTYLRACTYFIHHTSYIIRVLQHRPIISTMRSSGPETRRSRSYLMYFFIPIFTCAYLAIKQSAMYDSSLSSLLEDPISTDRPAHSVIDTFNRDVPLARDELNSADSEGSTGVDKEVSSDETDDADSTDVNSVDVNSADSDSSKDDSNDDDDDDDDTKEEDGSTPNLNDHNEIPNYDGILDKSFHHTGSFVNCTDPIQNEQEVKVDGPDSGTALVSCKQIKFRAPLESFNNDKGIITGILSSAGGSGPSRRQSIRSTWASNRTTIFFLVGGPWDDISKEYEEHNDLVWIDEEEVYNGEQSVLTLKTYSFLAITHAATMKYGYKYSHIFKTDDDSYVDIDALYHELHTDDVGTNNTHDYMGQCQLKWPKVHREEEYKWPIRNETYPEPWFPHYCQGAGFAISRKFVECAVSQQHIAHVRFMPFEDVAVGMLAERCGVDAEWPTTARVNVNRFQSEEVKLRTRTGDKRTDDLVAPAACMKKKIVQHRIIDDFDMEEHYKAVLDPSYCDVTNAKRDKIIKEKEEQGIEWFG